MQMENIINKQKETTINQEIITKTPIAQSEINQIRKIYKLNFPCPHCKEKINDEHFDEGQRAFQLLDEKLKEIVERHLSFQKQYLRNELIKEIKESRAYEGFPEIRELRQNVEKFKNKIIELNSSEHV